MVYFQIGSICVFLNEEIPEPVAFVYLPRPDGFYDVEVIEMEHCPTPLEALVAMSFPHAEVVH